MNKIRTKESQRDRLIPLEGIGKFLLESPWDDMAERLGDPGYEAEANFKDDRDTLFTSLLCLTAARPG